MELNFYTLCVIYLVYSFLGWVAETVVATIKGRAFVNRGVRPVLLRLRHGGCADGGWLCRPALDADGPLPRLYGQRHRGGVGDGQAAREDAPSPLVGLLR